MKRPSKKAFKHNIEAEMHAGKPQDQSLAIAYSIQRQSKKKQKAHGGMMHEDEDMEESPKSVSEAIMRSRKKPKGYADGGEVDLDKNAEEMLAGEPLEDLNEDAALKELYDDEQLDEQPEDSNEQGDEREHEEEDLHDMVSSIRKRMKYKMKD